MFVKRKVTENVYVTVLQRLNDMVKAFTALIPMSSVGTAHPSVARLYTDVIGSHKLDFCLWYALTDKR